MSADAFSHAAWYFVMSLIAVTLLLATLILVHDILTGRFKHWGYWRRMHSARRDQFQGLRRLR